MKCTKCDSPDVVKRGFRKIRFGKKQLYLCKKCSFKFTPDDGFLRMRFPIETIRKVVALYNDKDYSTSEVVKKLQRDDGIKISRWTVILWTRKYGRRRV